MFRFPSNTEEEGDVQDVRRRFAFFIALILCIIFLTMSPGRILPGSGGATQTSVQAAEKTVSEVTTVSLAPEIGPVSIIPDVMNGNFCTAVARVTNPSEELTMQGAEGAFTLTGARGRTAEAKVYLDALPPGAGTYVICNYIPAPGGTASGKLNLYPTGWSPGKASALPRVSGGSIISERARKSSGYTGYILFASGRLTNDTGAYIRTLEVTAVGLDASGRVIVAESFCLYDLAKNESRDFRCELTGVYPSVPALAQTVIEARPAPE